MHVSSAAPVHPHIRSHSLHQPPPHHHSDYSTAMVHHTKPKRLFMANNGLNTRSPRVVTGATHYHHHYGKVMLYFSVTLNSAMHLMYLL